jgi:prevent-host-death family protein
MEVSMEPIGSFEAKTQLPQLLEQVAKGEEFTITRHGKPVARLVPATAARLRRDVRAAVEATKQFCKGRTLGEGLTVRDLIEEGRRFSVPYGSSSP